MLNRRNFLAGAASAVGILGEMPKVAAAVPKAVSELGRASGDQEGCRLGGYHQTLRAFL